MCLVVYVQDRNRQNIKYYNCLGGTILGEYFFSISMLVMPWGLLMGLFLWSL